MTRHELSPERQAILDRHRARTMPGYSAEDRRDMAAILAGRFDLLTDGMTVDYLCVDCDRRVEAVDVDAPVPRCCGGQMVSSISSVDRAAPASPAPAQD